MMIDAETADTRELANDLPSFSQLLVEPPYAYIEPYIVDMQRGRVVGSTWGPIVALSARGAYLLATIPETPEKTAEGPLYWVRLDSSVSTRRPTN